MPRLPALLLAASLAACGPVAPWATLPPDAVAGSGDPTRAAILGAGYAFSAPERLAGRPRQAAIATAQLEHLATELPAGPRWVDFSPLVIQDLLRARGEWRDALGIGPAAPPQAVVDGLFATARALSAGDAAAARQALPPEVFADPALTLRRLANLPPLPRTQLAAARTEEELRRVDMTQQFSGGAGGAYGQ